MGPRGDLRFGVQEYKGTDQGADPDLERQATGKPNPNGWSFGNIPTGEILGNLLIISENNENPDKPGYATPSDDEGKRPAGSLFFDFDVAITSIGFDLIDVEGPTEFGANAGYVAVFKMGNTVVGQVGFGDLIDSSSEYYDPTVKFGDNSANRIQPISFDGMAFNRVEFNMGGSGAITNLKYSPVPEPAPIVLLSMGLALLTGTARSTRRSRLPGGSIA